MKRVKVLIPFVDKATGTAYKANDEIELSDERVAEVKAVNPNMLLVLGEKPKTTKKTTKTKVEE